MSMGVDIGAGAGGTLRHLNLHPIKPRLQTPMVARFPSATHQTDG